MGKVCFRWLIFVGESRYRSRYSVQATGSSTVELGFDSRQAQGT